LITKNSTYLKENQHIPSRENLVDQDELSTTLDTRL